MDEVIARYHASRESGSGCPETNGGPHYFAFIDCGEPEGDAS